MAWVLKMDDASIESGLVHDFDASLSGIGQELGAGAYSMRLETESTCQPQLPNISGSTDRENKIHSVWKCYHYTPHACVCNSLSTECMASLCFEIWRRAVIAGCHTKINFSKHTHKNNKRTRVICGGQMHLSVHAVAQIMCALP